MRPQCHQQGENPAERSGSLVALARLFLRLGATSFGGPAAHIALMEHEVIGRLGWLTHDEFLDLLGATNLIPGPNSTEMAIFIGYRRAGWKGMIVAGICFIAPAAFLVVLMAWLYLKFGTRPEAARLMYGIKPVIIAIVAQAIVRLGRHAMRTRGLALVCLAGVVLNALGMNELVVLFGTGLLVPMMRSLLQRVRQSEGMPLSAVLPGLPCSIFLLAPMIQAAVPFSVFRLFLFFLKVGSVLFGSGYVLLAFLRADLVEHWGWLSESQLLDAIAVGQVTPGPVFTTATFIGYILGGMSGALVATVGIFLPSFVFVAISGPILPALRRSAFAGSFLDGVNAASLALMAVVVWDLGRAAVVDPLTATLAAASGIVLVFWPVNSIWLVLAGTLAGLLAGR